MSVGRIIALPVLRNNSSAAGASAVGSNGPSTFISVRASHVLDMPLLVQSPRLHLNI
jgi:hypothetical protein